MGAGPAAFLPVHYTAPVFGLGTAFFLLLTLLTAAVLVIFMFRSGRARPLSLWGLAALLPLLAAMSAAQASQSRAQRALRDWSPVRATYTVHTAGRVYAVTLSGEDAACLEQALRLRSNVNLRTPAGLVPVREGSTADGPLPSREVVGALGVRGTLSCRAFEAVKAQGVEGR